MDPTTTLITFMLQTLPSIRSVQLIGSWDNFTKHYTMEKDIRRGRGQWRGCYAFDNIIYDGDGSGSPMRKGGLKMGQTYWYYYKVDGDIETHDPAVPSTTACPLLPGQTMNVLSVPREEVPVRDRSASVGSLAEPLKTMNPDDKYETPRPPPPTPKLTRLNTSTGYERTSTGSERKRPTRSESQKISRSPWSPKALFWPKTPTSPLPKHFRSPVSNAKEGDVNISYPVLISRTDEGRKCVSLQEVRQQQNTPTTNHQSPKRHISLPKLNLRALEASDDDDDANFASIQRQDRDSQLHPTVLSPPPSRLDSIRSQSSASEHAPTLRLLTANLSEVDTTSKPLPSVPLRQEDDKHPTSTSNWPNKSHFSLDSLDEIVQEFSEEFRNESSLDSLLGNSESDVPPSGMISPTDSQFSFGCASPSSLPELSENDDTVLGDFSLNGLGIGVAIGSESDLENLIEDGSEVKAVSPTRSGFQLPNEVTSRGFAGYSLPDPASYGSDLTLKRQVTIVEPEEDAVKIRSARATFGASHLSDDRESGLQGLLDDLGYLGEVINN